MLLNSLITLAQETIQSCKNVPCKNVVGAAAAAALPLHDNIIPCDAAAYLLTGQL